MILTNLEIIKQVSKKNINIEPFNKYLINPNSYNYRLDYELLEFDGLIDAKEKCKPKKIILSEDGYVLQPNKLYLASTFEKIGSRKYLTQLIGRSSVGRLGLFLQITAPIGHVGTNHKWTLELKVVQPLKVYPLMKIGQVTFWKLEGDKTYTYETGKYNSYREPHISLYYENGGV
jgi:dCTP deaminase